MSAAITSSDGAIGYIEWSFAESFHLNTAQVRNGAGEFVGLSNEAAGRTVASAEVTGAGGDLRLDLDYGTTVAGAYPIVLVTYEVVTRLGYAPLPEEVRSRVATTVAGLS